MREMTHAWPVYSGHLDLSSWTLASASDRPTWQSQDFAAREEEPTKRRPTRYERFTTRMVLVSSVLMLVVTTGLHLFNYGLETKTSSTSGTHGDFYKDDE